MGHKFAEIAFTPAVRELQTKNGSRGGYANMENGHDHNFLLTDREARFIQARDSFYMASVSETGWPYVQHRGGPPGFMRVLDSRRIGFADFSGNRQYVSTGNFANDDRVSLLFMDYPNRARLKVLGRVTVIDTDDSETIKQLEIDDYSARVERGFLIHIEAFDWNCPQHITPRFTETEVQQIVEKAVNGAAMAVPQVIGSGPLELIISGVLQLTPQVRSYELRDPTEGELPVFEAGSFLTVPVQLDDGEIIERHYSICSHPRLRDRYEIAVQRENDGRGGSIALHDTWQLGTRFKTRLPDNNFSLHPDDRPMILIAGGIGITPIKAMVEVLLDRGSNFQVHYAGRDHKDMGFLTELEYGLGSRLSVYSSAENQRLDVDRILHNSSIDAEIVVCGPPRLIDATIAAARSMGIEDARIRFERFEASIPENAEPFKVKLTRSNVELTVKSDESLLDAMLEAGIDSPYSCKAGNCRTCAVKVIEGDVEHHDNALSEADREDSGLMCPCVSRARSDRLVLEA